MRANTLVALLAALALIVPSAFAQDTDRSPIAMPGTTPTADENPALVETYQATITPDDLAAHLYLFASDYFEGRETAQRGQHLAAQYLAAQYRKMGLAPAGTVVTDNPRAPERYFQPFPLYSSATNRAVLTITGGDLASESSVFSADEMDGRSYLAWGGAPETSAGVVFGGFGISDEDAGYDDLAALKDAGLDISESWLLILGSEPTGPDGASLLTEDGTPSRWATNPNSKLQVLFRSGMPKGLLMVADLGEGPSVSERAATAAARLGRSGRLRLDPPAADQQGGRAPMYMIDTALANRILAPSGKTVADLAAEMSAKRAPSVFSVPQSEVVSLVSSEIKETSSENVLAFIEGSDPALKKEIVVISSHYDHVGMTGKPEGEDQVYNGADDDGSGTVAVLEMAEAFQHATRDGYGPRRSILFLNVAGEEKGLLGSAYYTDREPVFPLENTVTDLNIDMIGRIDPTHPGEDSDYVYIIGSDMISQELHDINLRMNTLTGIDLDVNERFNSQDDPNRFYARSDHWNFGKNKIPFIFFFTGTHEDYHGEDDEPEKIEYERMARITQLIFATAWQVANQDLRPAVSGEGFN